MSWLWLECKLSECDHRSWLYSVSMLILFPLHAAKHEKSGMPCSKFWDWIQLIARRYVIILLEIFHQQTKHELKHVYDFVMSKLEQASGAESSRHEFPQWWQWLYSWATVPSQIALREEFKQSNFQCHTLGSCTYLCHFFPCYFFTFSPRILTATFI